MREIDAWRIGITCRRQLYGLCSCRCRASTVDCTLDVRAAKVFFRVKAIVRFAENTEVRCVAVSAEGPRSDVVNLEKAARRAAIAVRVLVDALFSVTLEDLAPCRSRQVSTTGAPAAAGPTRLAAELLFELGQ